jgi:hypothetical protein
VPNTYTDDGSQAAGGLPDMEPQASAPTLKDQVADARDRIGELNRTVRDEARGFASSAREQAASRVEQRKQKVTGTIHDFADAVRRAGDELNERDQTMAARMVSRAAEGLEDVSRSLADRRPSEMIEAVRDFGRRNPAAFLAGSVLLGVAVGRFLRSSRPEPEYDEEGQLYAAGIGGYEREPMVRGDEGSSGADGLDANSRAFDAGSADATMTPDGMGRSDAETGGVISASGLDDSVGLSAGTPSDTGTDANSGIAGQASED